MSLTRAKLKKSVDGVHKPNLQINRLRSCQICNEQTLFEPNLLTNGTFLETLSAIQR